MGWRRRVAAAGEVIEERIADFDRDPRLVGSLRRLDLQDVDGAELVAQDRTPRRGLLAIKRLEAATSERGDRQRDGDPNHCSMRRRALMVASPGADHVRVTPSVAHSSTVAEK